MSKTFYIETLGCQMNKLDSELICGNLMRIGYQRVNTPEKSDIAIINTCSVRKHAELKALSKLGHYQHIRTKFEKPKIIAIVGCFAQRDPEYIKKHAPFVDIICGPNKLYKLPQLIEQTLENKTTETCIDNFKKIRSGKEKYPESLESFDIYRPIKKNTHSKQAFVRIQRGCDKFCSYCIVPFVRGPEWSRPIGNILDEVKRLDDAAYQEITLLGQTVNSYKWQENGTIFRLPDLLYKIHSATSIPRIKFITSYPADFSDELFYAMKELPRVCNYLHIPAQHGSDRILKLMNRKYSSTEYLELIEKGKQIIKDISFAGDFIVGFPTETEDDHSATLRLIEKVHYKNCFIFKYSPRPGTLAYKKYADNIPDEIKIQRFKDLQQLQKEISLKDNQTLIGKEVEILVEGKSKKQKKHQDQLVGRTKEDKIVVFQGPDELIGQIIRIKIEKTSAITLFGKPLSQLEEYSYGQ